MVVWPPLHGDWVHDWQEYCGFIITLFVLHNLRCCGDTGFMTGVVGEAVEGEGSFCCGTFAS